jgi:hypothetical protein
VLGCLPGRFQAAVVESKLYLWGEPPDGGLGQDHVAPVAAREPVERSAQARARECRRVDAVRDLSQFDQRLFEFRARLSDPVVELPRVVGFVSASVRLIMAPPTGPARRRAGRARACAAPCRPLTTGPATRQGASRESASWSRESASSRSDSRHAASSSAFSCASSAAAPAACRSSGSSESGGPLPGRHVDLPGPDAARMVSNAARV